MPKKFGEEGGGVSRFYVENLLSRSAEDFRRESFTVALFSSIEKVWIRGGIKVFRRKFSVSQCRNFWWGNPLLLH